MKRPMKILAAVGVVSLALSACEDNDDLVEEIPEEPEEPEEPAGFEDQFGANFGSAFRADPNSDPVSPEAGDLIDVTLKEDPVDVPNDGT